MEKRLATGSLDGTVRIWNVASHENIATLKVTSSKVWSVGFTPDGQWLVTGSSDGVAFREVDSWRVRTNFPGQVGALSKTGTFLATVDSKPYYYEPAGAVTLWNWRTGQLLRRFEPLGHALALSSDGRLLALAGADMSITVWDTASGNLIREWPMKHPVWSLQFSPDDRELVSAGWSREVLIWKIADTSPPRTINSLRLNFWSAVYSPDGADAQPQRAPIGGCVFGMPPRWNRSRYCAATKVKSGARPSVRMENRLPAGGLIKRP